MKKPILLREPLLTNYEFQKRISELKEDELQELLLEIDHRSLLDALSDVDLELRSVVIELLCDQAPLYLQPRKKLSQNLTSLKSEIIVILDKIESTIDVLWQ